MTTVAGRENEIPCDNSKKGQFQLSRNAMENYGSRYGNETKYDVANSRSPTTDQSRDFLVGYRPITFGGPHLTRGEGRVMKLAETRRA